MERKSTIRNVLVAVAIGALVGIVIGALNYLAPGAVSGSTATVGVGAAIGVSFAILNNRKAG
jgi:hypothetical protein